MSLLWIFIWYMFDYIYIPVHVCSYLYVSIVYVLTLYLFYVQVLSYIINYPLFSSPWPASVLYELENTVLFMTLSRSLAMYVHGQLSATLIAVHSLCTYSAPLSVPPPLHLRCSWAPLQQNSILSESCPESIALLDHWVKWDKEKTSRLSYQLIIELNQILLLLL